MKRRITGIIASLITIFVLGVIMHDFKLAPDDWNGGRPILGVILLGLHMLVALGLLIGGTMIFVFSIKSQDATRKKEGIFGFVSIVLALLGGIATVMLKGPGSNIGMFFMTIGFLTAFISYGRFFYLLKK